MAGFDRDRGELLCDGVQLAAIAAETGTPVHVYSGALIDERFAALDRAFAGWPHRLHYALKANATLAIVRRMRELGAGADANSSGEIQTALRAGFTPDQIVCTGVGKSRAELQHAIGLGVSAINVESPGEIERIAAIAAAEGRVARVAVRVNPDVDAGSHPHISTGHQATKFGVVPDDALAMIRDMTGRPAIKVVGLHMHIGSQVRSVAPITQAARTLVDLAATLAAEGIHLEHLDVGGGLGIAYAPEDVTVPVEDYASAVLSVIKPSGLTLLLEPGRWLVGPAGVLVTTVVDLKRRPGGGWFVVSDAGMTDLIRPALYDAWHAIEPVVERDGRSIPVDIVGPVCETSDTLGRDRRLPPVLVGDLLVIRDTGAYGAVMASNYNRRPAAAEVLVDAGAWRLVRRRQTLDDLMQWDV
jgi:diaminopimelate decarboxylase